MQVVRVVGTYFCVNMALITLSAFLASIVINTHIRGDRTNVVPRWLKRVNIFIGLHGVMRLDYCYCFVASVFQGRRGP